MKKSSILKLITTAALALTISTSAAALSACGKDDKTITVAASVTPHAEILTEVVKPILKEQGYTLKVVEFLDYVQPNLVVEQGGADANYFQHNRYLEDFNATRGTHLVAAAQVHYEPFGVYRGSFTGSSLRDLPNGAKVGIPSKENFLEATVTVSPMETIPGSNTPMISPA